MSFRFRFDLTSPNSILPFDTFVNSLRQRKTNLTKLLNLSAHYLKLRSLKIKQQTPSKMLSGVTCEQKKFFFLINKMSIAKWLPLNEKIIIFLCGRLANTNRKKNPHENKHVVKLKLNVHQCTITKTGAKCKEFYMKSQEHFPRHKNTVLIMFGHENLGKNF